MTLAPELPGANELIDRLFLAGVAVSAGHTDATAAEAELAFDRGVRAVTHLFNAMRPLASREPGPSSCPGSPSRFSPSPVPMDRFSRLPSASPWW